MPSRSPLHNGMVLSDLSLLLFFILLLPFVACDGLPGGDHRRSGAQGMTRAIDIPNLELPHVLNSCKAALMNNTIWILGGLDISTANSSALPCMFSDDTSVNDCPLRFILPKLET